MNSLRRLSLPALVSLADSLENGRLQSPFSRDGLRKLLPHTATDSVCDTLQQLSGRGVSDEHLALTLRLLAEERAEAQAVSDRLELVWSGPEEHAGGSRDTSVVVRELFKAATKSVLVASYAIDSGEKAEGVFGALAGKMDEDEDLEVRLCLNVHRDWKDKTAESVLLRQFADHFKNKVWPGERLPMVFHDPRSLSLDDRERACLHAKVIVVDREVAFVSSANFTEAAHERNIEAGVLVEEAVFARSLEKHFRGLIDGGVMKRIPGIGEA